MKIIQIPFLAIITMYGCLGFFSREAYAIVPEVVEAPGVEFLLKTNNTQEILRLENLYTTFQSQVQLTEGLIKEVRDGDITKEMLDFALIIAERCAYRPPAVLIPEFPEINLNICQTHSLPTKDVAKKFSFTSNMDLTEKKRVLNNIETMRKGSYEYSLALGLATRAVSIDKDQEKIVQQMGDHTLSNQAFLTNQIGLAELNELVELRRVLGALLENIVLDKASSFDSENSKRT